MACIKWTIGTMVAIVAVAMSVTAFFSPWWSETQQEEESKEKTIFYSGLSEFGYEQIQTENDYKFLCPGCGDLITSDEESLDYYKRYSCPYCDDQIGYSYDSLDDLKVDCPECGLYVGKGATSCNNYWGGCGAKFSEPVAWCDNCDRGVAPTENYYCYKCRDTFTSLDKEIQTREGDSQAFSKPLANAVFTEAEKGDGVLNKVGVANVTYYIWLIGLIVSGIALMALIEAGINRTNPYIGIISLGLAVLMTSAGVIYFSTAWGGAYDQDWKDEHEETDGIDGPVYFNGDEPEQVVSGFWGSKRYQPDEDDMYTDYSWGPSAGWIFGLISVGLGFVAAILLFISKNELSRKTGTKKVKRTILRTRHVREDSIEPPLPNSYEALYGKPQIKGRREPTPMALHGLPPPPDPMENSMFRRKTSYDEIYNTQPGRHRDSYGYPYDRPRPKLPETYGVQKGRFPPPPY